MQIRHVLATGEVSNAPQKTSERSARTRARRIQEIGTAVVEILAREGARRLTHRRIDQALGVPEGTTSAYCRTREALLGCGHAALVGMSVSSFEELLRPIVDLMDRGEQLALASVAECLSAAWTGYATSVMMKAQLEFLLEAARSPELHRLESEYDRVQHRVLASILDRLGAKDPQRAAIEFANWMRAEAWTDYLAPAGHVRRPHDGSIMCTKLLQMIELAEG